MRSCSASYMLLHLREAAAVLAVLRFRPHVARPALSLCLISNCELRLFTYATFVNCSNIESCRNREVFPEGVPPRPGYFRQRRIPGPSSGEPMNSILAASKAFWTVFNLDGEPDRRRRSYARDAQSQAGEMRSTASSARAHIRIARPVDRGLCRHICWKARSSSDRSRLRHVLPLIRTCRFARRRHRAARSGLSSGSHSTVEERSVRARPLRLHIVRNAAAATRLADHGENQARIDLSPGSSQSNWRRFTTPLLSQPHSEVCGCQGGLTC